MPWDLPLNQAWKLDNFLIRPGKIIARGGFTPVYQLGASGTLTWPNNLCGAVGGAKDWWLIQSRATGTSYVDPWNAPLVGAASGDLAVPTGTAVFLTTSVNPASVAVTADQAPGPRWINFNGLLYGISYGASSAPTTVADSGSNYVTSSTNLITLPWKLTSGTAPTAYTAAPRGAFDIKGYQSRIWLLGGTDPGGGTTHRCNALYFTRPLGDTSSPALGSPLGSLATDWKDPVSGAVNYINMDNDASDYAVGLAIVRNGMLVFRRGSVWLLRGSTTANYQLTPIARDVGCIDARSIVETRSGVYFLSTQGLMLTNGTTIVNVSGSITHTLRTAIWNQQLNAINGGVSYTPYYACCEQTSQGDILMSIGSHSPSNGNYLTTFSAMYSPEAKAWTRITSGIWGPGVDQVGPPVVKFDNHQVNAISNAYAGQGPYTNFYPGPLICRENPKILCAVGDAYVTMLENLFYGYTFLEPQNTFNGNAGGLYDEAPMYVNGVSVIPLLWQTGLIPVVNTTKRKLGQLKRIYLDSKLSSISYGSLQPGWQVTPFDGNGVNAGATQLNAQTLREGGYGGPITNASVTTLLGTDLQVSRDNLDLWNEVTNDVSFQITLPGYSGATSKALLSQAEIYGMGVEYQNTSEARASLG